MNVIEGDTLFEGIQEMKLSTVVSEYNNVENSRSLQVETDACQYICADKEMFSNYKELNGEQRFIGNSTRSKIEV